MCSERSRGTLWLHPELPKENSISSGVSHMTWISSLHSRDAPVDARVPCIVPGRDTYVHLVQCFRYVCATAIVLLSLQSASAVMMLHHYCQKTQSSSLETWQKRAWIISPKPPVLQPFLQKNTAQFGLSAVFVICRLLWKDRDEMRTCRWGVISRAPASSNHTGFYVWNGRVRHR